MIPGFLTELFLWKLVLVKQLHIHHVLKLRASSITPIIHFFERNLLTNIIQESFVEDRNTAFIVNSSEMSAYEKCLRSLFTSDNFSLFTATSHTQKYCPLHERKVLSITKIMKSALCDKNVPSVTFCFFAAILRKIVVEELLNNFWVCQFLLQYLTDLHWTITIKLENNYCHGGENSTLDKVINLFLQAKPGTNSKYIQSMKICECP